MPINFHKKEPASHLKELGMADVVFARLRGGKGRVPAGLVPGLGGLPAGGRGGQHRIAQQSVCHPARLVPAGNELGTGVAYGYYFKSRDLSRISSISGSVVYTLRHQFMFHAEPKLYFGKRAPMVFVLQPQRAQIPRLFLRGGGRPPAGGGGLHVAGGVGVVAAAVCRDAPFLRGTACGGAFRACEDHVWFA